MNKKIVLVTGATLSYLVIDEIRKFFEGDDRFLTINPQNKFKHLDFSVHEFKCSLETKMATILNGFKLPQEEFDDMKKFMADDRTVKILNPGISSGNKPKIEIVDISPEKKLNKKKKTIKQILVG